MLRVEEGKNYKVLFLKCDDLCLPEHTPRWVRRGTKPTIVEVVLAEVQTQATRVRGCALNPKPQTPKP